MTKVMKINKEFAKMYVADVISRFGDSVDAIAYAWIIYEITGSKSIMAFNVGVNFLPTVFLTPLTEVIAEKMPKKLVLCVADVLRFCIVVTIVSLYFQGGLKTWIILLATCITSVVEAFRVPCGKKAIEILASDKIEMHQRSTKIAEIIGFMMVGLIIAEYGVQVALIVDAITFLMSCLIMCFIKMEDDFSTKEINREKFIQEIKTSFDYKNKEQIQTIIMSAFVNMSMFPLMVFQVNYVLNYLQVGTIGLVYLKVLLTLGVLLGTFVKAKKIKNLHLGLGVGLSLVIVGVAPSIENVGLRVSVIFIGMYMLGFVAGMMSTKCSKEMSQTMTSLTLVSVPLTAFTCSFLGLFYSATTIMIVFGSVVFALAWVLKRKYSF